MYIINVQPNFVWTSFEKHKIKNSDINIMQTKQLQKVYISATSNYWMENDMNFTCDDDDGGGKIAVLC